MGIALYDDEFLKKLDLHPQRETHARITALDYHDIPVEEIQGSVTSGTINIDGASAMRRTCQISIVAPKGTEITDYHWAFNHKFKVEIGLTNYVDNRYEDIVWFPQGVYIINNFSTSETVNGINVNISGQDKMCRLNGAMGGSVPIETNFSQIDVLAENGLYTTEDILIEEMIVSSVHGYGQEKKSNILVNDLDIQGIELWEYRGDAPLYMFFQRTTDASDYGSVIGLHFNGDLEVDEETSLEPHRYKKTKLRELPRYYQLNSLDTTVNDDASVILYRVASSTEPVRCHVIKIEYGQNAGYHQTNLTYSGGPLIVKPGAALSAGVLDPIKKMLGEFEYFYDVNGRFIFQKKKTYINEIFSPYNGEIVEPMMTVSPYSYQFDDLSLFTNIAYSPAVSNVKNDFVIWGATGNKAPIHVRYAIQKKPTYYRTCGTYNETTHSWQGEGAIYRTSKPNANSQGTVVDWREIIYRMALDYSKYNETDGFLHRIDEQNTTLAGKHLYPDGQTGYEQYYTDLLAFWRYLYDPWFNPSSPSENSYYPYQEYYSADGIKPGWNKLIHTNPEGLVFWFDFLDVGDAPLSEFSVDAIGSRTKVENVNGTASICLNPTPEVLFYKGDENIISSESTTAYTQLQINNNKIDLFNIAATNISLISKANDLIYEYACCQEGVNITSVPIYHLEPNTRIYVEGIGDLILNKISYNLSHGGTMSLTCTKVIQSIY